MEILFNKDAGDSFEILEVLGITDADFRIAQLWQYLRSASRSILKIIGEDNYTVAVTDYKGGKSSEFCDLVRYAVALDAFRHFAPLSDVSFTTQGRAFRRDDHMVGAFEWQIDKSDAAMERSYYKAVDEIIAYIQEDDAMQPSEYMQRFAGLYVPSLDEFQKYIHLNDSHLLYFKLAPSLRLCEQTEIMNRLGTKFLEYKKKELKSSYIHTLIQQSCIYFAMKDGIRKLSVQLFPEGLMKIASNTRQKAADGYDIEVAVDFYDKELDKLLLQLENEVKKLDPLSVRRRMINFDDDDSFVTTS